MISKSVFMVIMDNDNSCNQSLIKHTTLIPRTTLTRILKKLETKKILTIKEFGKQRKCTLTAWFINKDETGRN